jgi:DNA-binding IclR family transcriptional regulator
MFLSPTPGLDPVDPDPALLAFVKCHITSPAKWEVLRVLASHDGAWVRADELARAAHRPPPEVARALSELVADDVVEGLPPGTADHASYRLPSNEPTSVVLHRLIESATHSQELRAIIAAHLQHLRQRGQTLSSTAAA